MFNGGQKGSLSDWKCSLNTPTQRLAEMWKWRILPQEDMQETLCSLPAVLLQLGITVLLNFLFILSWLKFLSWVCKKKKENFSPHRNERVVLYAGPATPFSQSQGHRHAVAVCWHPCMNTKAQTWKSSPAFQLSSPHHCGKEDRLQQKKARKCSLVWSKRARAKIACTNICS